MRNAITMDISPLKRLPLELRLKIYDKVLYAEAGVKVTLNRPIDENKRLPMDRYTSKPHPLAIMSTCKEIAEEAAGTIFKINDFWSFVQTDDNSTAWGKRVRRWCRVAGDECLKRARNVQFDIGQWDSRPNKYPRGDITKVLHAQIGLMYQNLPRQLRQCEQSFKLRLKWSSGVKLADGSRDRLNPVTIVLPLWTDGLYIQKCIFDTACQARKGLWKCDYTWHVGFADGSLPAFVDPPHYNEQLERTIGPERSTLLELSSEIGLSASIAFKPSVRERLEQHAVDA